jgi:hypothetical protein
MGATSRVESPSFRSRSRCARCAAAAFASLHLLEPRQLAVWFRRSCSAQAAALGLHTSRMGGRSYIATHRCMTAVKPHVSKALAAFVLQRPLRCVARLHVYSQTTQLCEWKHSRHARASRHRHYKLWCHWIVFLGVLIPSLRWKLHDSLHMDLEGL